MKLSVLLEDAKKSHDTLVATLSECFEKIDAPKRHAYFHDDERRWVIGFDLALERSLLKIALADGRNPIPYLTFIRAMNYFSYDILDFTNEYLSIRGQSGHFIYDDFLDKDRGAKLMDLVKEATNPIIKDALSGAESADFVIDKDHFQIIEDNILRIVDCFLLVSKSLNEIETRKAIETVREEVLVPIIRNNDDLLRRTNL